MFQGTRNSKGAALLALLFFCAVAPAKAIDIIEISGVGLRFIGDEADARAGSTLGESLASLSTVASTLGIGAHFADPDSKASAGAAYFVTTTTVPGDYPLSDASFTVFGQEPDDRAGYAIAGRGDVNGDGTEDIAVGAWGANKDSTAVDAGALYIFFGGPTLSDTLSTAAADLTILGQESIDHFGWAVDISGDVNDDNIDDIVVGSPLGQGNSIASGEVFIFFGDAGFVSGTALDPDSADVHLTANETEAGAGQALTVGDVDNDGIDDIIVGLAAKDFPSRFNAGGVYGILGRSDWTGSETLILDVDYNFEIMGEFGNDQFGSAIDVINDLNGDGFNDLVIAAPLASPNGLWSGRVYIFGGGAIPNPITLDARTQASTVYSGDAGGYFAGTSLTVVRDVDGNGTQEILIGAPGADPMGRAGAGAAYLILTLPAVFPIGGNLDIIADRAYIGENPGDEVGAAVTALVDFNGDGTNDFAIGAPGVDNGPADNAGAAYVVSGDAVVAVADVPTISLIGAPYPNPARGAVRIPFFFSEQTPVTLRVLDVSGRLVRTLAENRAIASTHVTWDGRNERGVATAPGVYFVRLDTPAGTTTRQVTLVR